MKIKIICTTGVFLLALMGCGEESALTNNNPASKIKIEHSIQTPTPEKKTQLAATINDTVITLDDIDKTIELKLFDLEWRKYELRKAALNTALKIALDKRVDQQKNLKNNSKKATTQIVEVILAPPTPPRLTLPKDKRAVKGNPNAPMRLSLFCSY